MTDENGNILSDYSQITNKILETAKPILKKFVKNSEFWSPKLKRMIKLSSKIINFSNEDMKYI